MAERTPDMGGERRRKYLQALKRKTDRRARAEQERRYSVWFGLGMFGVVGWSVAIPTLLGIALGIWMDMELRGPVSWTLTLMGAGLACGCLLAWYWVRRESRHE